MLITIGGTGGGGATALDGLTDAAISSASTAQQFRYANSAWRNATPQRFNLWDYILDQLDGAAYITSHRLFGCSITSGAAVLTSQTDQFTEAMEGRTILVDQAGAAGGTLTTTISTYTNARSVTLAANASTTVSLKGTVRIAGTNISTALDACLAAAGAAGGGMVEIPPGAFVVSGNHEIPDDVWIEGAGHTRTILMLATGAAANTDVLRTKNFTSLSYIHDNGNTSPGNRGCHGFGISRLMIDGDFRNNASARGGLALYGFDYYLKDLLVAGCKSWGILSECNMTSGNTPHQLGTGPGGIHTYWDRVMVQNCADSGRQVNFLGPHDSYIQGLDVYKDGSYSSDGLYIGHSGAATGVDGGGGSQFSDIHVWGNHTTGVNVASGGTLIDNLQSEGGDLQLRIAGAKIKVNHARLYGVTGTAADEGLEMASGSDNILTNLKIEDCDVAALRFTSGSTNCLIQGTASSDNGTPPPLVVGTRPVSTEVELLGVAGYDRSYRARAGHAVVAGDFGTFSSTWGSSGAPSIAVATGGNVYRGNATITAGGATGIGANPTVVFTFPKAFTAAPVVLVGRSGTGAGGTSNFTVENISTTSCRIIYGGTPTATATYSFSWIIQE